MNITKRMDFLEKKVEALTESIIKSDKVMKLILRQTDILIRELENSKLFEIKPTPKEQFESMCEFERWEDSIRASKCLTCKQDLKLEDIPNYDPKEKYHCKACWIKAEKGNHE